MLFVVILWEDPLRLAALVILKELVPAEVVVILPVLVMVAPVAELSANGVLDNGKFNTAAAVGDTATAVAEVFDWQNKCVVFVIFVSGAVGGVKSAV